MINEPSELESIAKGILSDKYDTTGSEISRLDTLIHAFWLMFKKNGFTNEMLDEALDEALAIEAEGNKTLKGMVCPNCGRKAQFSGHFKIKCISCGSESVLNPYEARDIAIEMEAAMAQQQAQEDQKERWSKAVENDPYQPYDVSKDLQFDDYDNNNSML